MYMHLQRDSIPLQGLDRCALTVRAIIIYQVRTAKFEASLAPFHQLWIYMVSKKYSGKVDQSTLASGGSEYV